MLRHLPPTAVQFTWPKVELSIVAAEAEAEFRAALSRYLAVSGCYLASSGRSALYLLLQALSEPPGQPARREVVLPAYTCPAVAKVLLDAGLRPRPVDISPQTLEFDYEQLAAVAGEQTLAVICVHPFGLPQPLEPIRELTRAVGAVLIEDGAQALGARWNGQPAGTGGDFGLFSLGPGKPLSTGGGGVVCVNRPADIGRVTQVWATCRPPAAPLSGLALVRFLLFSLAFHPSGWWFSTRVGLHRAGNHAASWGYRLTGLTSAQSRIGLASLRRLDDNNRRRRENARRLTAALGKLDFVHIPPVPPEAYPIYLRLPLILSSPQRREALLRRLWAAGIGAGRMYRHPLTRFFPGLSSEVFPGAERVAGCLLTLPTHHYLTPADIERIVDTFWRFK